MNTRLRAILFDMDGVLVDSEPLWRKAEIEVFGHHEICLTDDMCRGTKGKRLDHVVSHWLEHFGRDELDAERIEHEVVDKMEALLSSEAAALPGVVEVFELCEARAVPWNIATSSTRRLAEAALRKLGLWEKVSDRIVTGDQVTEPKPAPEIFIEAARRIGVEPAECLVIEDSTHGCLAGKRAGATVLVVPEVGAPVEGQFDDADVLQDVLRVEDISRLLGA